MTTPPGFERHEFGDENVFLTGWLPALLIPHGEGFENLWNLHPVEYHEIKMHGRLVRTPRWQQAYGVDYHYTGVNWARDLPEPMLVADIRNAVAGDPSPDEIGRAHV